LGGCKRAEHGETEERKGSHCARSILFDCLDYVGRHALVRLRYLVASLGRYQKIIVIPVT
jgi:hypothetical protein